MIIEESAEHVETTTNINVDQNDSKQYMTKAFEDARNTELSSLTKTDELVPRSSIVSQGKEHRKRDSASKIKPISMSKTFKKDDGDLSTNPKVSPFNAVFHT
jgi:hypothetical protein